MRHELDPEVYGRTEHVDVRCGTFGRMGRGVYVRSEVKDLRSGAAGKPSVNSASVACIRPETG